eukprot:11376778-Alexandrium_andersonii.AAC.1
MMREGCRSACSHLRLRAWRSRGALQSDVPLCVFRLGQRLTCSSKRITALHAVCSSFQRLRALSS